MNEVTLSKDVVVNDENGRTTGELGRIELAPGLTVEAYLSPDDGALVVQIDTPSEGEHDDQHERARVYMNEAKVGHWTEAV